MAFTQKKYLRDIWKPFDRLRYAIWRRLPIKAPIVVTLERGLKVAIRPSPTMDLAGLYEIFFDEAYQEPMQVSKLSPRLIVDVGANVGYSVLYWSHIYPNAQIIAFEPHPAHVLMLYRHLELNALLHRCSVVASAISNFDGESFLTDNGLESVVTEKYETGQIHIKVRDLFNEIGNQKIDLLKMDIEGSEYAILNDPRFETLDVRIIVLEWHDTDEVVDGRQWCIDRLSSLGFSFTDGKIRYENSGIIWAWKND